MIKILGKEREELDVGELKDYLDEEPTKFVSAEMIQVEV